MGRKCKLCKTNPAEWMMQYVGDGDNPAFTLPGNHYRGFTTTPVCDARKETIQAWPRHSLQRKDLMDSLQGAVRHAL